jgi:protein regulator of cytokinesis 1
VMLLRLLRSTSCMQDQKKLQEQLLNEKETLFGSKPSPSKNIVNPRRAGIGSRASSIGGSQHSVPNRRLSLGNAIMHPGTPEFTRNGIPTRMGSSTKDMKPVRARAAAPSNFVSNNKDDSSSAGVYAISPRFR